MARAASRSMQSVRFVAQSMRRMPGDGMRSPVGLATSREKPETVTAGGAEAAARRAAGFVDVGGAGTDFAGEDFAGAEFAGAAFASTGFVGADFAGIDFKGADFVDAGFSGAAGAAAGVRCLSGRFAGAGAAFLGAGAAVFVCRRT
uniref:pentapeptide repeat-containing protein n=1 Tax=Selenomonas sp. TAMA-11512 TaxID=3095337 RepID=UPI00403F436C